KGRFVRENPLSPRLRGGRTVLHSLHCSCPVRERPGAFPGPSWCCGLDDRVAPAAVGGSDPRPAGVSGSGLSQGSEKRSGLIVAADTSRHQKLPRRARGLRCGDSSPGTKIAEKPKTA